MAQSSLPSKTDEPQDQKQYEVQFQDTGRSHSETDDLDRAKLYARSLANWNHAAQVFDRRSQTVIFKAAAYNEACKQPSQTPAPPDR